MLQYRQILVPVDFSDMSSLVIRKGISAKDIHQCQLTLLHVVDYLPPNYACDNEPEIFANTERLIEQAEKHLADLLVELDLKACRQVVLSGKTSELLVEFVQQNNIDLIVMAAHNNSALQKILGSTTQKVIQNVSCDVLVIHG